MTLIKKEVELKCFHCGRSCDETVFADDKIFCCSGCKSVYEILNENDLCDYYSLQHHAGVSQKETLNNSFNYLDEKLVRKKLLLFDSETLCKVQFSIPAIHCASCIWLLENLRKLNQGIIKSEVTFGKKTVDIHFDPRVLKLSEVAGLLSSIGYTPSINLDSGEKKSKTENGLVYRLAVAGFVFGNVMLFSFPEYLGLDRNDEQLMRLFSWLNLILSTVVFVYSAKDYFTSALLSFKQRQINIDVPIAAGFLALFFRSSYDIITATGPGYLDSFTGLVFFLLIGRWFQSKTYESLSFDRDFKSYFPLAVNRKINNEWKPVVIYELNPGDNILIRNMEIVPADSILAEGEAYFDYSFVTGEARPTKVKQNETVYAGGRLIGKPVELLVEKKTSQSHLTSLWNNNAFKKISENNYQKVIDRAARNFTWIVMFIALATAVYWYLYNPQEMWLVVTSVLMVACPCALALAAPFTYGTMLRAFGRNNFYLKNADVIERISTINAIVFDKTGTVTHGKEPEVSFSGWLTDAEIAVVKKMTSSSAHPLSTAISKFIKSAPADDLTDFKEIPGKGIEAYSEGNLIRIGSALFVNSSIPLEGTHVFVSINDVVRGYFTISVKPRKNIKNMLSRLGRKCVALLSGDNEADRDKMAALFDPSAQLLFNQSPHQKLAFIASLQKSGKKVMMIGDGLNDSGALKQSDVGIAVTDDTGIFTPACDGIITGEQLTNLHKFLSLAKSSGIILRIAFTISFSYNAIALTFAATGHLTPLVAAILMPLSSISVVGFATLAVNYVTNKKLTS